MFFCSLPLYRVINWFDSILPDSSNQSGNFSLVVISPIKVFPPAELSHTQFHVRKHQDISCIWNTLEYQIRIVGLIWITTYITHDLTILNSSPSHSTSAISSHLSNVEKVALHSKPVTYCKTYCTRLDIVLDRILPQAFYKIFETLQKMLPVISRMN